MDNKRLQKRIAKNLLVKVKLPAVEFLAYVQDVNKGGLCIAMNRELEKGVVLDIDLNVPEMKTMHIKGVVAWRKDLPSISKNRHQVGVRITDKPDTYDLFVENLLKRDFERRRHERFQDVLEIKNNDIIDLLDAATTDVSAGGFYIRTGKPLPVGAQYEVALTGAEFKEPLICLVEVVTSFECDADNLDHPYGAGVKIISFQKDDASRFTDYIKSLEEIYRFHWPPEMK